MTDVSEQQPGPGEERGWADRVTVAPGTGGGGGFAYLPGQVVTDDAGRASIWPGSCSRGTTSGPRTSTSSGAGSPGWWRSPS
jgi:hypothetical protein